MRYFKCKRVLSCVLSVCLASAAILVCAPKSKADSTTTTYEGENGTLLGGAMICTDSAASGGEVVGYINAEGNGVQFSNVPAGNNLTLHYAAYLPGTTSVYINGVHRFDFTLAGHYTWYGSSAYSDVTQDVTIPAGATIKIEYDSGDIAVNVDYITITASSSSSGQTTYEGESGTLLGGATICTDSAASGGEVVGYINAEGNGVQFSNVPAGNSLTLHYAAYLPGTTSVYINGSHSFDFTLVGHYTWYGSSAYSDVTQDVTIPAGATIKIEYDSGDIAVNVDYITIRGTAVSGTNVPSGWNLVFDDEFSGSSLDTSKWQPSLPFDVTHLNDELECYTPDNVSVSDGLLTLQARQGGATDGQPYSSGVVTTKAGYQHFYVEARVKLPKGQGFWPAFWCTSADNRWPPEWDFFEVVHPTGEIYGYPHPVSGGQCDFLEGVAGSDDIWTVAEGAPNVFGWVTYGFLETSTDAIWYVNGRMTEHYRINSAAGSDDHFWIMLNLAVGGSWPGNPDSTTPFPSDMQVDYVRIWQP